MTKRFRWTDKQRHCVERQYFEALYMQAEKYDERAACDIIRERTGYPKKRIMAYVSNFRRTKLAVRIIENTKISKEKKSEGAFVFNLLQIYEPIFPKPCIPKSRDEFLQCLKDAKERVIHISSHGAHVSKKECYKVGVKANGFTLFACEQYYISSKDIEKIKFKTTKHNPGPDLVVSTACYTGRAELANAFKKAGIDYYVAPMHPVYWVDSALFVTNFYYNLFILKHQPWVSFKNTIKALPDREGGWGFWEKGVRKTIN